MDKTIVWIEDDTAVIDPVVRPLERAGHQFIRLRTVREALDAMDTMRQADLILLDMALPPADTPYDTDERVICPTPQTLSTPVIVMHGRRIRATAGEPAPQPCTKTYGTGIGGPRNELAQ